MKRDIVFLLLSLSVLAIACEAKIKIDSHKSPPNPIVNAQYHLHDSYETKVLKDVNDPKGELVEAIGIYWEYFSRDNKNVNQESYEHSVVLKSLVTTIQHKEEGRNFIEWLSRLEPRIDGVIENSQLIIHRYPKLPSQ